MCLLLSYESGIYAAFKLITQRKRCYLVKLTECIAEIQAEYIIESSEGKVRWHHHRSNTITIRLL